jgi:hypothetical protein
MNVSWLSSKDLCHVQPSAADGSSKYSEGSNVRVKGLGAS